MKVWTKKRIALGRQSLLEWEGTPHYNCLRTKGVGVDCVNLVSAVYIESGILDDVAFGRYSTTEGQDDQSGALLRVLAGAVHLKTVKGWRDDINILEFGDIAVFRTRPYSAHMAIYDGEFLWHSIGQRAVLKTPMSDWEHRISSFHRVTKLGWKNNPGNLLRKYSK